jgi:pyruvate,orthophosphate dikinase
VAFTRNPWTGANEMVMDFRFGVQGEDVVSGEQEAEQESRFRRLLPKAYKELLRAGKDLEVNIRDMQDLEFTVQEGELYLLQTRDGKRSPLAALRIAVELAEEGSITPRTALERLKGIDLDLIQEQRVVTDRPPLGKGIPASVGIVTGEIALTSPRAVERAPYGPVLLVKGVLTPDDLTGVAASAGIVTAHGNRMAHAVVVARQLGKACVVNVTDLVIDRDHRTISLGGIKLREGAQLSMDSRTGELFEGAVEVVQERPMDLIARVERWKEELESPSGR